MQDVMAGGDRPWEELIPDALTLIFKKIPFQEILTVIPRVVSRGGRWPSSRIAGRRLILKTGAAVANRRTRIEWFVCSSPGAEVRCAN